MKLSADSLQHQCFVYQGAPSSHLADIARTLVSKLKANHRCMYLNSPPMVAGMRWHLASLGVDLFACTEGGSLVTTSDQSHLSNGKFDVSNMIRLLEDSVQQARADGYLGLWAAGDMTWEFGSEENMDKLLEYERQLEGLMRRTPDLSGVCLYNHDTLPLHAINTALITHPAIYRNSSLSQINPDYFECLPTGS